jgi:hypothetical protein
VVRRFPEFLIGGNRIAPLRRLPRAPYIPSLPISRWARYFSVQLKEINMRNKADMRDKAKYNKAEAPGSS